MVVMSGMTHPCKLGHVFYADVISASQNMLWVFPGVIPTTGGKNEVMGTPNDWLWEKSKRGCHIM